MLGIVVQDDLIAALKKETIFAAGLDVVSPEPLAANHPLMELHNCCMSAHLFIYILFMFNVGFIHCLVVTPHLGSATFRTNENMANMAIENMISGLFASHMVFPVLI